MAKKKKVDSRPWVNRYDIVVYDGTKESVDKIHAKASKLGGFIDKARYSTVLKRMLELTLYLDRTYDNYLIIPHKSVVVFTDSAILWYKSEKKALAAVRVRTGMSRVSVKIETDDKIVEYVIPQAASVDISRDYQNPWLVDGIWDHAHTGSLKFEISRMVPNKEGCTHVMIDRAINPDYEVPETMDSIR